MEMKKCDYCGNPLDVDTPHYMTVRKIGTDPQKTMNRKPKENEIFDFCSLECRDKWKEKEGLKR